MKQAEDQVAAKGDREDAEFGRRQPAGEQDADGEAGKCVDALVGEQPEVAATVGDSPRG